MKHFIPILILPIVFLFSCSSSQTEVKEEQKKEPDVYVFDDASKVDSAQNVVPEQQPDSSSLRSTNRGEPAPTSTEQPQVHQDQAVKEQKVVETPPVQSFVVQVGAFSSKERAETFMKENQAKVPQKMSISFNSQVQLYVIQLPQLNSREDAEKLRDELWEIPVFKDAFIVPVGGSK